MKTCVSILLGLIIAFLLSPTFAQSNYLTYQGIVETVNHDKSYFIIKNRNTKETTVFAYTEATVFQIVSEDGTKEEIAPDDEEKGFKVKDKVSVEFYIAKNFSFQVAEKVDIHR